MASLTEDSATADVDQGGVRRRDFINVAAASFAGVGAVSVALPLINQMNPSADVLAEASTEVDLSAIQPGQSIKTMFRKQPLFVRHLTPAEIASAEAVSLSDLRDPQSLEVRHEGLWADHDVPELPRIALRFSNRGFGDLRGMIDLLNSFA